MDFFNQSYKDTKSLVTDLSQFKETLLSNLIMLAEILAPTGETEARANAIANRLSEYEIVDVSIDKIGNVIAKFGPPHTKAERTITLLAHMDTLHRRSNDHTVTVHPNFISGIGLADNSLGAAVLLTIPHMLQRMNCECESDIILCFATDTLGTGDLMGTRFFLDNVTQPIQYGICVEGFPLGRTSYSSIGMLRGEIHHSIPEEFDWSRFGGANTIVNTNHIINRILEISLPSRPRTSIVFNKIRSGSSFNNVPTEATLLFEVRSQSNETVNKIQQQIEGIISESEYEFGAKVSFKEIARRSLGGLSYNHPLVRTHSNVLRKLGEQPRVTPSVSDLSAFIDKGIPAVGLGITRCERYNQPDERLYIAPCFTGIAQVLMLLSELDAGLPSEEDV